MIVLTASGACGASRAVPPVFLKVALRISQDYGVEDGNHCVGYEVQC